MRTNLLIFAFILAVGTIEAYPSEGQRFARQAEEDEASTEKVMMDVKEVENLEEVENMEEMENLEEIDNMDEIVNNEVENPEIIKDMPENTEIEVKVAVNSEKEGEMMKDEMAEVEDENEVEVEAPVEKTTTTTTTTTKAPPTIAPLGVTLRSAVTQRRTARPTTRRTTTTARTTTQAPAPEPGFLGRLGNLINSGFGNVFSGAGIGSNVISTGSLLAAAASPLWAPLLVGKKRRKRSEDVRLNEIQQAYMQYYIKLIMSHIKQAKDNYH